jgi:hypothetical protein
MEIMMEIMIGSWYILNDTKCKCIEIIDKDIIICLLTDKEPTLKMFSIKDHKDKYEQLICYDWISCCKDESECIYWKDEDVCTKDEPECIYWKDEDVCIKDEPECIYWKDEDVCIKDEPECIYWKDDEPESNHEDEQVYWEDEVFQEYLDSYK